MGDTKDKFLPGTATSYVERGEKGFSKIEMLLEATGGLSLSQVCAVTGLEGSTIQNWVKRGWVAHPKGKRYEEVHIARILIINALKECIKLEHIAHLMSYVNSSSGGEITADDIIKESELYNFLCDALAKMGQAGDNSRGGVESVVEMLIKDYTGPRPDSRVRIRKALTVMIYACVCTDVKRRTESMIGQILHDLEHPENVEAEVAEILEIELAENSELADDDETLKEIGDAQGIDTVIAAITDETEAIRETGRPEEPVPLIESSVAARKTVSQALREWDISSVERLIIDHNPDSGGTNPQSEADEKSSNRPWYLRRGSR